jgi:hypothetical protein
MKTKSTPLKRYKNSKKVFVPENEFGFNVV